MSTWETIRPTFTGRVHYKTIMFVCTPPTLIILHLTHHITVTFIFHEQTTNIHIFYEIPSYICIFHRACFISTHRNSGETATPTFRVVHYSYTHAEQSAHTAAFFTRLQHTRTHTLRCFECMTGKAHETLHGPLITPRSLARRPQFTHTCCSVVHGFPFTPAPPTP